MPGTSVLKSAARSAGARAVKTELPFYLAFALYCGGVVLADSSHGFWRHVHKGPWPIVAVDQEHGPLLHMQLVGICLVDAEFPLPRLLLNCADKASSSGATKVIHNTCFAHAFSPWVLPPPAPSTSTAMPSTIPASMPETQLRRGRPLSLRQPCHPRAAPRGLLSTHALGVKRDPTSIFFWLCFE